jgi:hypothetical protein
MRQLAKLLLTRAAFALLGLAARLEDASSTAEGPASC